MLKLKRMKEPILLFFNDLFATIFLFLFSMFFNHSDEQDSICCTVYIIILFFSYFFFLHYESVGNKFSKHLAEISSFHHESLMPSHDLFFFLGNVVNTDNSQHMLIKLCLYNKHSD